jgi:hypothetical protein
MNHAFTQKTSRLGMVVMLLFFAMIGASSSAIAQTEGPGSSSRLAELLGILPDELVSRTDSNNLPVSPIEEDNLTGQPKAASRSALRPDIHGETSVENFRGHANNLTYTHESAAGFRNWLGKWYATNFHYKDSSVTSWLFHDNRTSNYDLWPSGGIDYGIDAVRVEFHSSHGDMNNNIFTTWLGGNWNNTGWTAKSNKMALGGNYNKFGDERLRYQFWDTCYGVRISNGNSPYSTWAPRSKGIRFVFGYETTSIDSPNYGKFFGQEWDKGKTLKLAFLDASWRINTGQSPVVLAFGATQSQAVSRRDSERTFSAAPVSKSWGAWSWYNARVARGNANDILTTLAPVTPLKVTRRSNSAEEVAKIANTLGIRLTDAGAIQSRSAGLKLVHTNAMTLSVERTGNFELSLITPEEKTPADAVLSEDDLIQRGRELAEQFTDLKDDSLCVGMIRYLNENDGSKKQKSHKPRVTEKTVVFDQMINGAPFIDPEAGHLEITFDSRTGQTKRVRNTLKTIPQARAGAAHIQMLTLDQAREAALTKYQNAAKIQARAADDAQIMDESEAVGYQLMDGNAVLVYRVFITSATTPGMRPFQAIIPLVM